MIHGWLLQVEKNPVFYSPDKGKTCRNTNRNLWQVFYSRFYDNKYEFAMQEEIIMINQTIKLGLKMAAKTWQLAGQESRPWLRIMCAIRLGSNGRELVCVFGGIFQYSQDGGANWSNYQMIIINYLHYTKHSRLWRFK